MLGSILGSLYLGTLRHGQAPYPVMMAGAENHAGFGGGCRQF